MSAKRTPIGSFMGQFKNMPGTMLGSAAARGAIEASGIQTADIEESYFGNVISAGMGQAPDRQVMLEAGCPVDTPSTLVNKVCASGMKSVMMAA